ncbi:heat shock factor protein 5 [Stegastes partitus]|uniref:Heat shock factor protein 5 n=1 Tax=Stegastes partitus TaxID=144197 RepID=A0A9Y4K6I1_9TELE|nr:PREDICTED: heat shock factor protein 5 [Stegastes partitus]
MDACDYSLPLSINPNNFTAKLWRLVNNPANDSICWDGAGEVVVIHQQLFEQQILRPGSLSPSSPDAFKTTNFSSFVRQLNLYGFKKVDPDVSQPKPVNSTVHHFFNANFKRNHPELVASLIRLTSDNKAKLQAGLNVNCRPPSRYQLSRGCSDGKGVRSWPSPARLESAHPYYPRKALNGTPVPPWYLMRGLGAALSPADKETPACLSHPDAGGTPSPNAVNVQPRANQGNPHFAGYSPHSVPYQPDFCSPAFHCYYPKPARPPVNMVCHGARYQDFENNENQKVKKGDTSLDAIFQMADEVMQTPPSNCLVKVETPEKPASEFEPSSNTCKAKNSGSTTKPSPLRAVPVLKSVPNYPDLTTYKQHEESVVSVPKQMPKDVVYEETEVVSVGTDTVVDASQDDSSSSSSTGRTPGV